MCLSKSAAQTITCKVRSRLIATLGTSLPQTMADMRGQGNGFTEIARALDVRAQEVRTLMFGLVTFAIEGDSLA